MKVSLQTRPVMYNIWLGFRLIIEIVSVAGAHAVVFECWDREEWECVAIKVSRSTGDGRSVKYEIALLQHCAKSKAKSRYLACVSTLSVCCLCIGCSSSYYIVHPYAAMCRFVMRLYSRIVIALWVSEKRCCWLFCSLFLITILRMVIWHNVLLPISGFWEARAKFTWISEDK